MLSMSWESKSFGFKVCWLNRTGASLDPLGLKPNLVVSNFDKLVFYF